MIHTPFTRDLEGPVDSTRCPRVSSAFWKTNHRTCRRCRETVACSLSHLRPLTWRVLNDRRIRCGYTNRILWESPDVMEPASRKPTRKSRPRAEPEQPGLEFAQPDKETDMVNANFGGIEEVLPDSGGSVPPGTYTCEVFDATERMPQSGQPYINFGLRVVEGEYEGRTCAFEKLFFGSQKALERAKFVLQRLGLGIPDGQVKLEAEKLNGRRVLVTTELDPKCPECKWTAKLERHDGEKNPVYKCVKDACGWEGGKDEIVRFTKPKYAGYEGIEPVEDLPAIPDDEVPF